LFFFKAERLPDAQTIREASKSMSAREFTVKFTTSSYNITRKPEPQVVYHKIRPRSVLPCTDSAAIQITHLLNEVRNNTQSHLTTLACGKISLAATLYYKAA